MGLLDKILRKEETHHPGPNQGVHIKNVSNDFEVIDQYYVHEPIAQIKIVKSSNLGAGLFYFVDERQLNEEEEESYRKIMSILSKEMEPPTNKELTPEEYVLEQAETVADKYYKGLGSHTAEGWDTIFYYVVRNLAGYGSLHAIMLDPNIEDISNNGLDSPVYVWHRKYESIPTNVTFIDERSANDFIVKLAHKSSKHISSATPIMDGMLPEKHRLAATFMNEVSMKGSTFCIRKFKKDPFSIIDLIEIGTIDTGIAAYFWFILEHKMSFMIIGGTGAGKTSILNSLLSLMSRNDKIVTVEEVPELSPPLPNWTQLNSRASFQFGERAAASISIFELVKVSLRYRPDYIIVGEVRGEEAFTLFQALATGHGGLCTMHADSLSNVIKRLTSPPMNVSKVYIPLMNNALHIQRVELPRPRNGLNFGRRVRTVWEIEDVDNFREIAIWNPRTDTFDTWFENSIFLEKIAIKTGKTKQDLLIELEKRKKFIIQIIESGVRDQTEVAEKILEYYTMNRQESKIKNLKEESSKQASKSRKSRVLRRSEREYRRGDKEADEKKEDLTLSETKLEDLQIDQEVNPLAEGEK